MLKHPCRPTVDDRDAMGILVVQPWTIEMSWASLSSGAGRQWCRDELTPLLEVSSVQSCRAWLNMIYNHRERLNILAERRWGRNSSVSWFRKTLRCCRSTWLDPNSDLFVSNLWGGQGLESYPIQWVLCLNIDHLSIVICQFNGVTMSEYTRLTIF